jgi:hypothetical protein
VSISSVAAVGRERRQQFDSENTHFFAKLIGPGCGRDFRRATETQFVRQNMRPLFEKARPAKAEHPESPELLDFTDSSESEATHVSSTEHHPKQLCKTFQL